jgi:hypothetical protein
MTLFRIFAAALGLGLLSACGADGPPERPEPRPSDGIRIDGSVSIGIAGHRG